jgi:CRP/FNR family transcriptional regulator, cyclic AMP receptor protein
MAGGVTFDPEGLLPKIDGGETVREYRDKQLVFSQGDVSDAVFYIRKGTIKITALSRQGKEAVVAFLEQGAFFGEDCLIGQRLRRTTATSVNDSTVVRFKTEVMLRMVHEDPSFSDLFMFHLVSRKARFQEDLVDQLFNSAEQRLARKLLLLAHFGKNGEHERVIPNISQGTLAEMIGTTRPRVSYFMNKFRKLGLIDYKDGDGLRVHSSLLNIVLHEGLPKHASSRLPIE